MTNSRNNQIPVKIAFIYENGFLNFSNNIEYVKKFIDIVQNKSNNQLIESNLFSETFEKLDVNSNFLIYVKINSLCAAILKIPEISQLHPTFKKYIDNIINSWEIYNSFGLTADLSNEIIIKSFFSYNNETENKALLNLSAVKKGQIKSSAFIPADNSRLIFSAIRFNDLIKIYNHLSNQYFDNKKEYINAYLDAIKKKL